MKNRFKISLANVLTLSIGLMLLSCGSSKSTDSFSSRLTPGSLSTSNKPLAWCNSGASPNYAANQKAYKDANGNWNPQYGFLKFTAVPQSFANNNRYIQFYRWMASVDPTSLVQSTSLDSTPLRFMIYDLSTNQPLTDWRTTLGWGSLASIQSSMGIVDVTSFFKRIALYIDIRDQQGEYDVLRTVIYRTADNMVDEQFDSLLPVFNANPADYAVESSSTGNRPRAQVLQDLHPLKGTALSDSEYTARMNSLCDTFSMIN